MRSSDDPCRAIGGRKSGAQVIAQDFIKSEALDIVAPLYRELVQATRQEPLCISYELFTNQSDPGHFVFIETWPDRAALDQHCATEHFRRLVPQINAHQRAPCAVTLMDGFAVSKFMKEQEF
ncbi:putative quinol monooxygenase [Bosea thiooxidans]